MNKLESFGIVSNPTVYHQCYVGGILSFDKCEKDIRK